MRDSRRYRARLTKTRQTCELVGKIISEQRLNIGAVQEFRHVYPPSSAHRLIRESIGSSNKRSEELQSLIALGLHSYQLLLQLLRVRSAESSARVAERRNVTAGSHGNS